MQILFGTYGGSEAKFDVMYVRTENAVKGFGYPAIAIITSTKTTLLVDYGRGYKEIEVKNVEVYSESARI
jgi:hypothetical protein